MDPVPSVQLNSCQCRVQPNNPGGICDGICRKQAKQALVGVHLYALPSVPSALHHFHILNDGFVHTLVSVCQMGLLQQRGKTL